MLKSVRNIDLNDMRNCATAFSRKAFTDILEYGDYSVMDNVVANYEVTNPGWTYSRMLDKVYDLMVKNYRCEYVFKNEVISKLLLKKYGTKNTVYFSEFRLRESIADLAMFNGESKAFEIKTEYDSPRRLRKQLEEYSAFFDKVYLVIPSSLYDAYSLEIAGTNVGVIVMDYRNGKVEIKEQDPAYQNDALDVDVMMASLREDEYKAIVKSLTGIVPEVPSYKMFESCTQILKAMSVKDLKRELLGVLKKRRNITNHIRHIQPSLRQMMLSLNLTERKETLLLSKFNKQILM